ncbi:hypothetical protein G9A89_003203 [Geosiphon pyriformis]|nr:hypothetical protein G9A89_009073 [Geosiphon pyriformis]KAG9301568.1 hypothetical protein G9A89_003203 [Geosiphon pyriformis]
MLRAVATLYSSKNIGSRILSPPLRTQGSPFKLNLLLGPIFNSFNRSPVSSNLLNSFDQVQTRSVSWHPPRKLRRKTKAYRAFLKKKWKRLKKNKHRGRT